MWTRDRLRGSGNLLAGDALLCTPVPAQLGLPTCDVLHERGASRVPGLLRESTWGLRPTR